MRILRVFVKNANMHFIDFPAGEAPFANILGFWKMEGVLSREDPQFGVPAALPWDSWLFCCILTVETAAKPGASFDFLQSKPN
jgi:hypothetical protein